VLIGYLCFDSDDPECNECAEGPCLGPDVPLKIIGDADEGIFEKIMQEMDAERIRENLRYKWSVEAIALLWRVYY
jgi:hypothetical protein